MEIGLKKWLGNFQQLIFLWPKWEDNHASKRTVGKMEHLILTWKLKIDWSTWNGILT